MEHQIVKSTWENNYEKLTGLGYKVQRCTLFSPIGFYHSGWDISKEGTGVKQIVSSLGEFIHKNQITS